MRTAMLCRGPSWRGETRGSAAMGSRSEAWAERGWREGRGCQEKDERGKG